DTPPPVIYTLSLHDALPISAWLEIKVARFADHLANVIFDNRIARVIALGDCLAKPLQLFFHPLQLKLAAFLTDFELHIDKLRERSEEHTSELQSQSNLVCRL